MITVPSRLRRLSYRKLSPGLKFNGRAVNWEDVFLCNLWADLLGDGTFNVKSLPFCDYFKRHMLPNASGAGSFV